MSEIKGLLSVLMLAFIFNLIMYGIFDYSNQSGISTDYSCGTETNYSMIQNATINNIDDVRQFQNCQPSGLPWWYYVLWGIINGALIYAFIPFVK